MHRAQIGVEDTNHPDPSNFDASERSPQALFRVTCKDASTKEQPTVEKLSRAVARNRVSRCAIFGACVARMDGRTMPRKKARFT